MFDWFPSSLFRVFVLSCFRDPLWLLRVSCLQALLEGLEVLGVEGLPGQVRLDHVAELDQYGHGVGHRKDAVQASLSPPIILQGGQGGDGGAEGRPSADTRRYSGRSSTLARISHIRLLRAIPPETVMRAMR